MDKVPTTDSFLDFSDYARPAARWLVRRLLNTRVSPNHITLAFTLAGLAAAALLASNRWGVLAGLLVLIKSGLDAADGALARGRGRPSRVGRFFDSDMDFVVNVALCFGIAAGAQASGADVTVYLLALASLVSALLQVSIFNHYYVRYRAEVGGDRTSQVSETAATPYAWDNPTALRWLFAAYRAIYSWQDSLVAWLDRLIAGRATRPITPAYMTAVSVLGLGTQLLVLALCAAVGRPVWALWLFVTLFNLYAMGLLLARRWA
ncbi:MAG: CDP-alcohol phosphatidyltransferase family protein [Anaerolineales bacterium]|nr:CDP-alcohol phosphatidyltransferase family protein [Anaerolineales bacterium]